MSTPAASNVEAQPNRKEWVGAETQNLRLSKAQTILIAFGRSDFNENFFHERGVGCALVSGVEKPMKEYIPNVVKGKRGLASWRRKAEVI